MMNDEFFTGNGRHHIQVYRTSLKAKKEALEEWY
jgi:hypothetical protein